MELRSNYHNPKTVKLRAPIADERPHRVHGGEVAVYLEAICAVLRFRVHPFF